MCSNVVQGSNICDIEPNTYQQVSKSDLWKQKIQEELNALVKNNTWTLVPLPAKAKPINSYKWVYKIKRNADDTIKKLKAILVARRYFQVNGVDYHDSFASVAKIVTIRVLLSIAAQNH